MKWTTVSVLGMLGVVGALGTWEVGIERQVLQLRSLEEKTTLWCPVPLVVMDTIVCWCSAGRTRKGYGVTPH